MSYDDEKMWRDMALSVRQAVHERSRSKGIMVAHVTLVLIDGELSCYSDPRLSSFGPPSRTADLAGYLAGVDRIKDV